MNETLRCVRSGPTAVSRVPRVFVGSRRALLAQLVLNGLGQSVVAIGAGFLVHHAFAALAAHAESTALASAHAAIGLVVAAVASAWLKTAERRGAELLGQGYAAEVRMALYDCIANGCVRNVHKRRRGALVMRFVGDLKALRRWASQGLARLAVASVSVAGAVAALAAVNVAMAATVSLVLGAAVAGCLLLARNYRAAVRDARREQSRLASEVNERIATIAVTQAFGQTGRERAALARRIGRLVDAAVAQAHRAARIRAVPDALAALVSAVVLLVGAGEVRSGDATVAVVAAALAVTAFLVPAMRDLAMAYVHWQSARVARAKLGSFLAQQAMYGESEPAPPLHARSGELQFRDVSVEGALQRFTAIAQAGERVAIVGPNGAGKSTLLRLAARLLRCDSGQILIDGQDVSQHSRASVQAATGIVAPDLPLLSGTIEYNLRYRCPDVPAAELQRVARLCGVDEIASKLPDGLSTRLSEAGSNLSPGHRSRIALARALLHNPALLLLDEVDGTLDPRSASIVDRVLDDYRGTVLVVTHRLERVLRAHTVWHVADGKLVECGVPRTLLNSPGVTSVLFADMLRPAC